MIEPANTPDWQKVVGEQWPEWNEDDHAQVSHGEVDAATRAHGGAAAVQMMHSAVTSTMTGQTADAAGERYAHRTSNLTQRGEFHTNRAVVAGLLATNTANAKASINAIAAQHEAQVQALKVRMAASGGMQKDAAEQYDQIVHTNKAAVEGVKKQHDDAHDALKDQFVNGDDPSVPASMPGGSSDGGATPDLPSDVQSKVGQLMGSGGAPGGGGEMQQLLGQGMGAMQGAMGQLGQLGQLTQHTPGADIIQNLGSLFQGMGQGGGDNQEVTPEALDKLLAGQDHHEGGGGDSPPSELADDVKHDDDNKPHADVKPVAQPEPVKPSPAAVPLSAAPPASAITPGTVLS